MIRLLPDVCNWIEVGEIRGFASAYKGMSETDTSPPAHKYAKLRLSRVTAANASILSLQMQKFPGNLALCFGDSPSRANRPAAFSVPVLELDETHPVY